MTWITYIYVWQLFERYFSYHWVKWTDLCPLCIGLDSKVNFTPAILPRLKDVTWFVIHNIWIVIFQEKKQKNIYQFTSKLVILMKCIFPRYQDNWGNVTILNLILEAHLDFTLQEIQIVWGQLNITSWSFDNLSEFNGSTSRLEPKWRNAIESVVYSSRTARPWWLITEYNESITVDLWHKNKKYLFWILSWTLDNFVKWFHYFLMNLTREISNKSDFCREGSIF